MRKKNISVSNALFDTDISISNDNTKHNNHTSNRVSVVSTDISNKVTSKNNKKTRKVDNNSTTVNDKSVSKSAKNDKLKSVNRKTIKNTDTANTKIELKQEINNIKVGRKDRKHNWWPNCDHVWVDGIDHWVSKTAFRNDDKNNQTYTIHNYVPGLDSYWVLRYKPENVITESEKYLMMLNDELKSKFKSWNDVASYSKLPEKIIEKYKDHISWYHLISTSIKNNREFSAAFRAKFSDKFKLYEMLK